MGEKYKDLLAGLVILGIYTLTRIIPLPVIIIAQFLTFFAILFPAYLVGKRLFPKTHWLAYTAMGLTLFAALNALIQSGWYYAGGLLNDASDIWIMSGTMALCNLIALLAPEHREEREAPPPFSAKDWGVAILLTGASLVSVGFVLYSAWRSGTLDSIRTPWPLMPQGTLAALAIVWASAIISGLALKSRALAAWQTGFALLGTTAIAPLIYRVGFGFDGFLHVASEKIMLATGTLSPKPLYYIGQYVFTTRFAKLLEVPVEDVDRWLVPLSAAILLPLAVYLGHRKSDSASWPTALFLLPLAPFVATTPQAFAYLLGLSALLMLRGRFEGFAHPLASLILAAWSSAVHPLAGIPFFAVCLALAAWPNSGSSWPWPRRLVSALFSLLAVVAVPLMFFVLGFAGKADIRWDTSGLWSGTTWSEIGRTFLPWIGNHFVVWPSWASLVSHSLPAILLVAAVIAIIQTRGAERAASAILALVSVALFASSVILKRTGDFAFLIDYERGNYAERLGLIATFILLAAALPAASKIFGRLKRGPPLTGAVALGFAIAIAAALSYDALPRHDALVTGRGWSVGQADIEAVRLIDRDAGPQEYTVLANQSVSAAAVMQLGFKRYSGDVFFYPIPTGGELYDVFLRMTYKEPTRDTASDAGKLGSTQLVYVVLNDYWWNAEYTGESLSGIADAEWAVGDAEKGLGRSLKVYRFDLSKPSKRETQASGS
jgi:hypothetical protein